MLKKLLLATTLTSFALAAPAFAENISGTITFTGSDTGTLSFTAIPQIGSPAGTFAVTSLSGTTDGSAVTGVISPGTYPPPSQGANDNFLFFPPQQGGYLDFYGLSYSLANGDKVNIFYVAPVGSNENIGYFTDINNNPSFTPLDFTATLNGAGGSTVTPEPDSLVLAGTGLVGLAGLLRRRFLSC